MHGACVSIHHGQCPPSIVLSIHQRLDRRKMKTYRDIYGRLDSDLADDAPNWTPACSAQPYSRIPFPPHLPPHLSMSLKPMSRPIVSLHRPISAYLHLPLASHSPDDTTHLDCSCLWISSSTSRIPTAPFVEPRACSHNSSLCAYSDNSSHLPSGSLTHRTHPALFVPTLRLDPRI